MSIKPPEDQFGGEAERKFTSKRFKDLLLQICSIPMAEQENLLGKVLENRKENLEQVDDITIMGVLYK